jgi:predicted DNA binding CopG/RHH family protein
MKFDREEKEILDAYEKGDIRTRYPSKDELKEIRIAAENTFKKNRRVTIRLYDHDFKGIQKKAMEKGIPYQTLISSMIHQYIEGELVEKRLAQAHAASETDQDIK